MSAMQRFTGLSRRLPRACQGEGRSTSALFSACDEFLRTSSPASSSGCTCGRQQTCMIHGDAATEAPNPDNKPTPKGKERHDPSNVKYDTPTKDEEDSSDWAPGFYDDKGKGGHREVASRKQNDQFPVAPGAKPPEGKPGDVPRDYNPDEADPVMQPKPEDPHKPQTPEFEVQADRTADHTPRNEEQQDPNKDPPVGRQGPMPDQHSRQAGMAEPQAPPERPVATGPASEKATPYNQTSPFGDTLHVDTFPRPAKEIAEEGRVKVGEQPKAASWER